ncbi:Fe-S cluster assembly protein SufB [archaeon]|nr:Fe-S cluster assembly protein SufB [archaeon]
MANGKTQTISLESAPDQELRLLNTDYDSKYGFRDPEKFVLALKKGLSREVIEAISRDKNEPKWMLDFRLRSYEIFKSKPMPAWCGDLGGVKFDEIKYYVKPTDRTGHSWEDVPADIKRTFERLGLPEAEQKFLGGVTAQYESNAVYHQVRNDLKEQGVIFLDTDTGLKEHEDIFKQRFGKIVPPEDNKFAALNSAVWSGGSFIYVPPGVHVKLPLQAYFRINSQNMGQFERTLIIADKDSDVTYIEGCSAPKYSTNSLHSAVVELIALEGARIRYTTIQNWANNIYNLVTKRAHAHRNATVEWIDGNMGSCLIVKFPSVYMVGEGAKADILSVAFAGEGQHQHAGAKALHLAKNTQSRVVSKSISRGGGRTSYRGLVYVKPGCTGVKSNVRCDALLLDEKSRSDTYPTMDIHEEDTAITHEATVGKISEDKLFYLMSRGIKESEAYALIVLGFIEQFTKELPMEYALELNRLVQLEMEGSVG